MSCSQAALDAFHEMSRDTNMPAQVAVIKALTVAVQNSSAQTVMELEREVKAVVEKLKEIVPDSLYSVSAGSELFVQSLTRSRIDFKDFEELKKWMIQTTESVAQRSMQSRSTIARQFNRFVSDGMTILTCSHSRVVMECFEYAAKKGKRFNVLVTESRNSSDDTPSGILTARQLTALHIPVRLVPDCAVAFHMKEVDVTLVGAEAVVESGGSIARPGPYQLAILAREFNSPFYIACESYKFTRAFPLTQHDLPNDTAHSGPTTAVEGFEISRPRWEYTPPAFITLLFSDLGVLTPSAVSDELIKLYLN